MTGNGKTIHISDGAFNQNHDSFAGKTITMISSTPTVSTTAGDHGTHVASTATGVIGATTHGVAPDADIAYS